MAVVHFEDYKRNFLQTSSLTNSPFPKTLLESRKSGKTLKTIIPDYMPILTNHTNGTNPLQEGILICYLQVVVVTQE